MVYFTNVCLYLAVLSVVCALKNLHFHLINVAMPALHLSENNQ